MSGKQQPCPPDADAPQTSWGWGGWAEPAADTGAGACSGGAREGTPHQPLEAQGRQPRLAPSDKGERLQAAPSPQAPPGPELGDPWENGAPRRRPPLVVVMDLPLPKGRPWGPRHAAGRLTITVLPGDRDELRGQRLRPRGRAAERATPPGGRGSSNPACLSQAPAEASLGPETYSDCERWPCFPEHWCPCD